jgi:hypothetical protein
MFEIAPTIPEIKPQILQKIVISSGPGAFRVSVGHFLPQCHKPQKI